MLNQPEDCCNLDEILILWGFKCMSVLGKCIWEIGCKSRDEAIFDVEKS